MDFGFWLLFLHLLGSAIWVGGHIILTLAILPKALVTHDPTRLLAFETVFERIGLPALGVQVVTGLWLSFRVAPDASTWINVGDPLGRAIIMKLVLLTTTIVLALHARLALIPRLNAQNLPILAAHVLAITLIAIAFVGAGLSLRYGGLP